MKTGIIILAWEKPAGNVEFIWEYDTPAGRKEYETLYLDSVDNSENTNVWLLEASVPDEWDDDTLTGPMFMEDVTLWLLGLATVPVYNTKPDWFDGTVVRSRIARRYVSSDKYV